MTTTATEPALLDHVTTVTEYPRHHDTSDGMRGTCYRIDFERDGARVATWHTGQGWDALAALRARLNRETADLAAHLFPVGQRVAFPVARGGRPATATGVVVADVWTLRGRRRVKVDGTRNHVTDVVIADLTVVTPLPRCAGCDQINAPGIRCDCPASNLPTV